MFNHVFIFVNNYEESCKFYDETLAILEVQLLLRNSNMSMYGAKGKNSLLVVEPAREPLKAEITYGIAFEANSPEKVQAWYEKCLALDAKEKEDGAPRLREEVFPGYYSAFLTDPSGILIEAVFYSGNIRDQLFNN